MSLSFPYLHALRLVCFPTDFVPLDRAHTTVDTPEVMAITVGLAWNKTDCFNCALQGSCPLPPLLPRGEGVIMVSDLHKHHECCEITPAVTANVHTDKRARGHKTGCLNYVFQGRCPLLLLLPIQGRRCGNCQYQNKISTKKV
jgi:hypothetical protein